MRKINKIRKFPKKIIVKKINPLEIDNNKKTEKKSVEEKLKETEEKLLRSLAEIENQEEDLKKK